jgi:serine/threonine-protein kinase
MTGRILACPDENDLARIVEGRLSADEALRLEEHVRDCSGCRDLVAAVARTPKPRDGSSPALTPTVFALDFVGEAVAEVTDPLLGRTLDAKWTIERPIGAGGMARVYQARHRNGSRVAIKVLRPELAIDPKLLPRFLREGQVANGIGHPGVVAVLDDGTTKEGAAYLVMELLVGETMRCLGARLGPMDEAEVLLHLDRLLDVLAAAHAQGIIHRDVKPENLLLTHDGKLKVLDFGIARFRVETATTTHATHSGVSMGTPAFMPPEQARGHWDRVDARSDLWAAGATAYALLAGKPPRRAATSNEELLLAMTQPVASIGDMRRDLSRATVALVDRALAFEPGDRFPDARAMQDAVRKARALAVPAMQAMQGRGARDGAPARARLRAAAVAIVGLAATALLAHRLLASAAAPAAAAEPSIVAPGEPTPVAYAGAGASLGRRPTTRPSATAPHPTMSAPGETSGTSGTRAQQGSDADAASIPDPPAREPYDRRH